MAQLETAIFTSDFDNIEKYSKKLRKKREISQALEVVLECYNLIHKNVRLHAATLELDLSHLIAYQIHEDVGKKIVGNLKKVLTVSPTSPSSPSASNELNGIEIKLTYVLLGIVTLFQFEKNSLVESLGYFDKIDFDLTKKFLLYEQSDTEIIQSSVIEKVFGILGLYFRGVALELHGRNEDALDQYQVIVDFLYRFRLVQFTKSRSVNDFITSSLYRSACLLSAQGGSLFESAQVFKSFLTFHQINPALQRSQPNNSTIRLIRALLQYMDLLDKNFRKYNYKNFCDETPSICSVRRTDDSSTSSTVITSTNTRKEEIILCTLLLESIEQNPLVKASINEIGGTDSKKRFARIGYFDGIVKIQKNQFQKDVSSNELFKNLFYSFMASEKYDLALLASRIYLTGNGHNDDPFTLLSIAKLYLTIPSKLDDAHGILFNRLKAQTLEAPFKISYHLLRGKYFLLKSRMFQDESLLTESKAEFSLLQQIDESCADAHFFLSLIAAHEGQIDAAEREIKRSLSIDSSQIRAWNLFALIKTIKKDFEACLIICNTELANMIYKDINLSLLKVSTLLSLNRSGEAIDTLKRIISAHFRKSLDIRMDGGLTVVSEGTLSPGNFLSKFLGESTLNGDGSINGSFDLDSSMFMNESDKITTFAEYTKSFPASLDEYLNIKFRVENESAHFTKSSILPSDILTSQDLKEQMYQMYQNNNNQESSNNQRNSLLTSALWIEVARIYLHEGLYSDAQAATNQAFSTNEVFAPIFGSFGMIQETQGNFDSAITFYRKGLIIDNTDESCILGLTRILLQKSEIDVSLVFEAEGLVRSLLQIDNSIPEAWSLLAQTLAITGRYRQAQEAFDLAIKKEMVTPVRSLRSLQI